MFISPLVCVLMVILRGMTTPIFDSIQIPYTKLSLGIMELGGISGCGGQAKQLHATDPVACIWVSGHLQPETSPTTTLATICNPHACFRIGCATRPTLISKLLSTLTPTITFTSMYTRNHTCTLYLCQYQVRSPYSCQ